MGSPRCPTCGVGEPWNRYSYRTTDGDGRPLIVYTESAGDGDRDECADSWHDDDLADRVLAQAKDPASPLSKALWHTPIPPAPADDASGAEAKSVAWAIRDRHGHYSDASRDEAKIRRDCDYLNRDSSTPYYIGQGPYEVVPLAPLPARDDAVEEAAMLREALLAQRKAWLDLPACGGTYCDEPDESGRMDCCQDATYHAAGEAIRAIDAALRREKGGGK